MTADSSYSASDMMSIVGPVSPLKLDIYHNISIRGCNKRCPCRTWINCHYYNKTRWKKLRGDKEIIWKEIEEWYENFFKYEDGLPDATYPNG